MQESASSHLSATSTHPVTLTPKEKQVSHWGNKGKSSWEIAQILACTEATVNFHFANIRRKFNVGSRWLALRKAAEMGLIDE
ncbi:response regulator transcription factor [Pseudomonas abietaniphila]|jgi:LuxR family quorum-sensing transcriptional regulator LasR|nr:LuxR family transcriptional regulator [Pseudomonas abietaniphila]